MDARVDRRRNPLADAGADRERLLGWPRIVVLGLTIVAAMVLLYPHDRLVEEVAKSETHDELTKAYLDNLLKSEPDNPVLLIKRADEEIEAGREREGEALLLRVAESADADVRIEAAEALVRLRERQLWAQPPGSAARSGRLAALHRALELLDGLPLSAPRRAALARKAFDHGAEEIALRAYRRLADEAGGEEAVGWLEEAARIAQSRGRYEIASALYFEARRRGALPERRAANFFAGVKALQAGNRPDAALAAAEAELGDLADDTEALLFVVRVARAADRNDRAEVYIRKLLRFALNDAAGGALRKVAFAPAIHASSALRSESPELSRRLPDCAGGADAGFRRFAPSGWRVTTAEFRSDADGGCWQRLAGVRAALTSGQFVVRVAAAGPQLPFNEEIYLQGYEIFLANRKLEDARKVAEAAVRQVPDSVPWRKRLAQVAEWNGKPALALEHWRRIAIEHDLDEAWQAVLRLAPGLFDEESVILALQREHRLGRLDDKRLVRLVEAFDALGEPQRGIDFLREAHRSKPRRLFLSQKAWLEERSAQLDEAIATLREIESAYGLDREEVKRLAGLLLSRARPAEAYAVLQRHRQRMDERDREYLELLAELGWLLQDYLVAKSSYQALRSAGMLEEYQLERLIAMMRGESPAAAAELAIRQWELNHSPRLFQLALDIHMHDRNPQAARALLARLTPAEAAVLEREASFLRLRSDVRRETGDLPGAIEDIRKAILRSPPDGSLHAQLIWLLIEARERKPLMAELARRHPAALDEPGLWEAMAAGYVFLSKPANALPYYAKQTPARQGDYLWIMNYAQTLEDAGQADMGWRLRRHAWLNLRPADLPADRRPEALRAMARAALRFAPGDGSAAWLRELLRQDVDGAGQLSPQAKELATAWFIGNERYDAARLWLSQQYGRQLAAPRWAEVALALQRNDKAELRRIADGEYGDEPVARVEAAAQIGDPAAVRRLATAGLETDPDNEVLHLRLTESLWQMQNRVALAYRNEALGALSRHGWRGDVQWHVAPRLRLSLGLSQDRLSSTDLAKLGQPPAHDKRIVFGAVVAHDDGETGLRVFHREAYTDFGGAEINHRRRLERRIEVGGALGYNVDADETAALRAAGAKDVLRLNGQWLIGRREYLLAETFAARYYQQGRNYLGHGTGIGLQLGHHLRTEYPNATLKFIAGSYRFAERGDGAPGIRGLLPPGASVLPGDFDQAGFGLDLGTVAAEQYSRAFRPYASLDLIHDSRNGWGYGLGLGFVVSPTGNDWLRGRLRSGRTTFSSGEDASLLELEYRYLF